MSCDHDLANEWARCSGKNASYITTPNIEVSPESFEAVLQYSNVAYFWKTQPGICEIKVYGEDGENVFFSFYSYRGAFMYKPQKFTGEDRG